MDKLVNFICFRAQSQTFGIMRYCDLAVWEVHIHIKQIGSVADFGINKSCNISYTEREHMGVLLLISLSMFFSRIQMQIVVYH